MQKATHVYPILGVKSVEQLEANLDALNVALTDDHIQRIEGTIPWDSGFPHNLLVCIIPRDVILGFEVSDERSDRVTEP